jgi:CheY-like chemotaxis protein
MVSAIKGEGPSPRRKDPRPTDDLQPRLSISGLQTEKNSPDSSSENPGPVLSPRTGGEWKGLPFFREPVKKDAPGGGGGAAFSFRGRAKRMEAIGILASGIAHDFNNILTPILLRSEMAMAQLQQDSPLRNQLEQIFACGQRARDLVQQILNFSHQDGGKPRPLQIALVVKEILKLLRSSLPATIEIRQDIRESGMVLADLGLIHMLLMELFARSYQPVAGTGGLLAVSLNATERGAQEIGPLASLPEGPYVNLTVKQEGTGFVAAKDGPGQGADIALIHSIVEQHGGKAVVTRILGQTVIFDVFLPRMRIRASAHRPETASLPRGSESILLVDDEKDIRETLEQMLSELGYTVVSAPSSAEALETFLGSPHRFDMVLTDLTMPGMTGIHLAGEVKRIRPGLPLLLCSGLGEILDGEELRSLGVRSVLMKPLSLSQVACRIRAVLDGNL